MFFLDAMEYEEGTEPKPQSFIDAVQNEDDMDDDLFEDPLQDISPTTRLGRAFHLTIDPNVFMREGKIYDFLEDLDNQELLGYNEPFDSLGYTMESVNNQIHCYSM